MSGQAVNVRQGEKGRNYAKEGNGSGSRSSSGSVSNLGTAAKNNSVFFHKSGENLVAALLIGAGRSAQTVDFWEIGHAAVTSCAVVLPDFSSRWELCPAVR